MHNIAFIICCLPALVPVLCCATIYFTLFCRSCKNKMFVAIKTKWGEFNPNNMSLNSTHHYGIFSTCRFDVPHFPYCAVIIPEVRDLRKDNSTKGTMRKNRSVTKTFIHQTYVFKNSIMVSEFICFAYIRPFSFNSDRRLGFTGTAEKGEKYRDSS